MTQEQRVARTVELLRLAIRDGQERQRKLADEAEYWRGSTATAQMALQVLEEHGEAR